MAKFVNGFTFASNEEVECETWNKSFPQICSEQSTTWCFVLFKETYLNYFKRCSSYNHILYYLAVFPDTQTRDCSVTRNISKY